MVAGAGQPTMISIAQARSRRQSASRREIARTKVNWAQLDVTRRSRGNRRRRVEVFYRQGGGQEKARRFRGMTLWR